MVLIFLRSDFKDHFGSARRTDIENFIYSMDTWTRVYQFATDTAPDYQHTECIVVKGWHGEGDDRHFTCRLRYNEWWYRLGLWEMKQFGSLHVYEDGRETRKRGKIRYPLRRTLS